MALKYGLVMVILLMNFKALDYFFFTYKISWLLYLGIVVFSIILVGTGLGLLFHKEIEWKSETNAEIQPKEEVLQKEPLLRIPSHKIFQPATQGYATRRK